MHTAVIRHAAWVTMDAVVATVRDVLASELYIDVPGTDLDLVEGGYLDSMDVVRLLTALETRYDIVIDLDSLEFADLGSVDSLAAAVVSRL